MIYGTDAKLVKTADAVIRESSHVFYLTGSRYFGTQTETSDFDYFVKDGIDVRKELTNNGFVIESTSYVGDPNIVLVYRRDNIHVQCVADPIAKNWIQWCMPQFVRQNSLSKELTRTLWPIATKLYYGGMDGIANGATPHNALKAVSPPVPLDDDYDEYRYQERRFVRHEQLGKS